MVHAETAEPHYDIASFLFYSNYDTLSKYDVPCEVYRGPIWVSIHKKQWINNILLNTSTYMLNGNALAVYHKTI